MAVKYLVSANGQDHLPVTGDDGKPDHRLMGAAWAALHSEYRGKSYEGPDKSGAKARLAAMYKSEGMDTPSTSDHADLNGKWIHIFQAGTRTDSKGNTRNVTTSDLDDVVRNYEPDYHEAPAVIGHPEDNHPAYGWTSALKRDGEGLFAQLKDVNPDFGELVEKRAFPKRSASFYVTPNGLSLRHIGFLGAQPPAVKGLTEVKFDEGRQSTGVFEFEEESMATESKPMAEQIRDGVKDFFASAFGGGARSQQTASFTEADLDSRITRMLKPLEEQNAQLKKDLEEQKTDFAERERKLTAGEHSGRVDAAVNKLRSAGKWVPWFDKAGLKLVFSELAKSSDVIEFGEGDNKKKLPVLDILVGFMEKLPKVVHTGEIVKDNVVAFREHRHGQAAELPAASQNSQHLHELVLEYQEKHDGVDYGTALARVAKQHPELTEAGFATAGAV